MSKRSSLLTLFSVVVIDLIGFGVVIPILPYLAGSFGASATVLGVLLTCYPAMQFLFAPVWGRLSDRIGRRPVMLITIAGTSLALLALGLAPSLLWLFVARLFGGLFSANISVATAYVGDLTEGPERTRWMGLIGAAFMEGIEGHDKSHLFREVGDGDPTYLIVSRWISEDAFNDFVSSDAFKKVTDWGKENILSRRPSHTTYQEG